MNIHFWFMIFWFVILFLCLTMVMGLWHGLVRLTEFTRVVFTVFYTGFAVVLAFYTGFAGLLPKASTWFGDGGGSSELFLGMANLLIYLGAAWMICFFFLNSIRKNSQDDRALDVYNKWRSHALQVILMGVCFQAVCLAKTDHGFWATFQSWDILLDAIPEAIHIEGGSFVSLLFNGLAVVVCYLELVLGRDKQRWTDTEVRLMTSKAMMLGVRLEYMILPLLFVWSVNQGAELLTGRETPNWIVFGQGILIGQVFWYKDQSMIARATFDKARL